MAPKQIKTRDGVITQFIDWASCSLVMVAFGLFTLLMSASVALLFEYVF